MKTLVLCENRSCVHHLYNFSQGKKNRESIHQCGSDKIEIGRNEEDEPVCYTELKEKEVD